MPCYTIREISLDLDLARKDWVQELLRQHPEWNARLNESTGKLVVRTGSEERVMRELKVAYANRVLVEAKAKGWWLKPVGVNKFVMQKGV